MRIKSQALLALLAGVSITVSAMEVPKGNLLKNGDFAKVDSKGQPADWRLGKNAKVEKVDGKLTLVIEGSYSSAKQLVNLEPKWQALHLSMKMRATDVQLGDANWKDGRLNLTFKSSDGKRVGNWPRVFNVKGTTDWKVYERDYDVPYGASTLEISPVIFGKSGKLEFQDIKLTVAAIDNRDPNAKPVIILKLDDVVKVTKQWQQCADFIKEQDAKASFGIIGHGLEKMDAKTISWIKQLHDSGRIEFWNHGYKNRSGKDKMGEFECDSVEEQKTSLARTQQLAKEKLGFPLHAFGPHWSGTNKSTVAALDQVPEIKCVFFYTAGGNGDRFVFKRYMDMEKPIFTPNFEHVKKSFENGMNRKPYLCLQGHANAWGKPERFENFKKIVRYFKEQGCTFMTPSEYLKSIGK